MKLGIISILLWLAALPLMAQSGAIQGHSFLGGQKIVTSSLQSSNYADGIVPHATITVYLTGTQTLATITNGQGNANPFTSNDAGSLNPGGYLFFASISQGYDVVASGGIAPNTYPAPVTLCTDCYPSSQFTVESGVTSAQGVAPIAVDNDSTSPHTGAITISCPECGGANFTYQYTPAASGQYVLVFPTICNATSGAQCSSGQVGNNGFANAAITWSGVSLPSYVLQANVTQVYAFAISYSNMTNAATASFAPTTSGGTSFACGDNPHCFLPPGAGTAYGITQVNIPQNSGTPPIVANLGAEITQCCNANGHVVIVAIGFEVHYTGAAPPTSNAIQVIPPLYYNAPAQTLSLSSPINQAQDFGTVNAYQAVVPLLSQGPVVGDQAVLTTANANTSTTPTFEVTNGVYNGAYTIINEDGSPLLVGEIAANVPVPLLFDGSHWRLVGAGGVSIVNGNAGQLQLNFSSGAGSCSYSSPITTCTFTGAGSGGGSVTNFIASTFPSWLTPSVATSTTTPTLTVTPTTGLTANQALMTPNGSSGAVALRAIVAADIPTLNQSTTGNAATSTAISTNGSTGQAWGMTTGSTQGWLTVSATPSFSALTGGTNTTAAMLVGTGASLAASGSGTIAATTSPFAGIASGTNTTAAMLVGTGGSLGVTGSGAIAATSVPAAGVTSGALANGMTGTTQSPGDNTTKLATDAFVIAAAPPWSSIADPTGGVSHTMAANSTTFTFNATTGSADLFKWADTASNTGTGIMGHFTAAASSTEIPWQADANGVGWRVTPAGALSAVGGTTHGVSIPAGTAVAGVANTVVYGSDTTNGYAEVNENNTGLSRICTATNGCYQGFWTLVQGTASTTYTFACTTGACSTGTVSATTAGNLEVVLVAEFAENSSGAPLTSNAVSGDTFTECPSFPLQYNNHASNYAIVDCFYKVSATGGATSFTVTPTWAAGTSSQQVGLQFIEAHRASGTATYDSDAVRQDQNCTTCVVPVVAITGNPDACFNTSSFAYAPGPVSGGYNSPANFDSASHIYGAFTGNLAVNSYIPPFITVATGANPGASMGAVCFK